MERFKRHMAALAAMGLGALLVLVIALSIVVNSGMLDSWVKEFAVAGFNKEFRGRLEVEAMQLNFPNRIKAVRPRLYREDDVEPVIEAAQVSARINFLSLLQPELSTLKFRRLSADSLSARLEVEEDGKLNIEAVFTSRKPDTTTTGIENWYVRRLQLKGSAISWSGRDSLGRATAPLVAQGVDLKLNRFALRPEYLRGSLEELAFRMPEREFTLREGSGRFLVTDKRAELLNLRVAGGGSRAHLSVSLEDVNLFDLDSATTGVKGNSYLDVRELALDSRDLEAFLPELALPEGLYELAGTARGSLERLELMSLELRQNGSRLALKGTLWNLADSEALAYRLRVDSSRVSARFLAALSEDEDGGELALKAGDIGVTGTAEGSLKGVKADLAFRSAVGGGTLRGTLSGEREGRLDYKGKLTLDGFEPHRLFPENGARSRISLSADVEGVQKGDEVERLIARVKLRDSFWERQELSRGTASLSLARGELQASFALEGGGSSMSIEGKADLREKAPAYTLTGTLAGIDLSRLVAEEGYPSDLNGDFTLSGKGLELGRLNASLEARFRESGVNGYLIPKDERLNASIAQEEGASRVRLTSSFLEAELNGQYSLDQLAALGGYAAAGFSREVALQDIWAQSVPEAAPVPPELERPFRVNYSVTVKESAPLAPLLSLGEVSFRGSAEGVAESRPGSCQVEGVVALRSLKAGEEVSLERLKMEASLSCAGGGIAMASAKGSIGSLTMAGRSGAKADFGIGFAPGRIGVEAVVAAREPATTLSLDMYAERAGRQYNLVFTNLSLADSSGTWGTSGRPRVVVERSALRFDTFRLAKGSQRITLDGALSSREAGSFRIAAEGLQLEELQRLTLDPTYALLTGTLNASLTIAGSPSAKRSAFELEGRGVRYGEFMLGTVSANARHEGRTLRFGLESEARQAREGKPLAAPVNTITGSGTVPLQLELWPLQAEMPKRERLDVTIRSDNLSASLLQYALPLFSEAEGNIPTALRITGRAGDPQFSLTTRLRDTKLRVAPSEVAYRVNGEIVAIPGRLELRQLALRDSLDGSGTLTGLIRLDGLKPGGLEIDGRFRQLLLYNKQDRKDETSFGTISASSNGVQLGGTLDAPVLEGNLRVNSASFALYRSGANESSKYIGVEKFIEFVPRYPSQTDVDEEEPGRQEEFYYSLIDVLEIRDLRLTSQEPLRYTMIFDRERGEGLQTTVGNLSLIVNKHSQRYRLFGSVDIAEGKYQFSNNTFDLESGGRIDWNNGEIRDGVITNLYASRYVDALHAATGERDNVQLVLAITGTINEPKVGMGYYMNDESQPYATTSLLGGRSSQIDPNAELNVISMMLSRQWYIRPGSNGQVGSFAASSVGISAGTGLLSAQLSSAVRELAGLESFNVNLGAGQDGTLSGLDLYFALNVPGTGGRLRFIGTGRTTDFRQSSLFGEYGTSQRVEYRISSKVFAEAYRSYGLTDIGISGSNLQKPQETWGVSLSYRERFHTWEQFWDRITGQADEKRRATQAKEGEGKR